MSKSINNLNPVLIDIGSLENLERLIQEYMPKISKVDIKEKKSPEELVEAFRRGFGLEEHNYLKKNDLGILCYDLMICRNPLEKEKKQLFYTFFSLKEDVYDPKVKLAKIYDYYLKHHDDLHIDTMLQICYSSADDDVKKEDSNRFDKYTTIQDGFYLKFDKIGDRCELYSLTDQNQPLSSFILDGNRLSSCKAFIPAESDFTEDSIKHCIGNLEGYIKEKVSGKSDEKTGYIDYASAFLGINTTSTNSQDKGITEKQLFENVYRISLINELAVPGLHYLYFIPLSFPNHSQIGHFVLSTSEEIDRNYIEKFRMLSFVLMFPLSQVNMSSFYIQKAKVEAIKSAKAAIMSRNLSHNLGSHVMSYLKQNFNSVQEIVANGTLKTVIEPDDEKKVEDDDELPLLVGMGKFISYLQERQDYIATVSTDYIPCQSVVNFKDAIYDELNPDYRFYRHKNNWKGHKPANILLQNIAKSEGLSRELMPKEGEEIQKENNILILFRSFDGLKEETKQEESDFKDLRKWNFSLPGGIMGRQAVFSIVENVIRNAAKHGSRQEGENLKLVFDIQDAGLESDTAYSEAVDNADLYVVTLTDNIKTADIDNIINDINNVIDESFYKEGTDLTASNKGIKEMIISAAWLRGIKIEEQDKGEKIAPILKARKSKDGCLQYVFCLPKVKKIAYIINDKEILEKNSIELNRLGWYLFDVDKYKSLSNKSFSFILLDKSLSEKREEIRKCSNNRFFVVADRTNYERREIDFEIESVLSKFASLEKDEDKEKYLKEVETALFAKMALSRDDESVKIAISDASTIEIKSDMVRLLGKESNITGEKFIYRTHNDSTVDFLGFLNTLKKGGSDLKLALDGVEFIEGITGGNSTDRIVRREVKDDLWVYQQIHSMKTRVAIFDERIFTRITGYEMSKLKEEKTEPIDWQIELQSLDIDEAKEKVDTYDFERKRLIDSNVFYDDAFTKERVVEFAQEKYPFMDPLGMNVDRVLPLVYHKKGIDVFTLTKIHDENNCFAVWTVRDEVGNLVTDTKDNRYKNNIYGRIEKVAELYFEEYTPKIKFIKPTTEANEFKLYDYVTIHQGLLDKVYQKMPIKDSKDETQKQDNIVSAKRALTKEISDKFVRGKCNLDNYLPGLTIHSGRSKPNRKDMPQNQPFIQYSAVENAVLDCKFTLVELLDFANYE